MHTTDDEVRFANGLPGVLSIPPDARGLVVFAHGSGSSRRSRRNRYVAQALRARALGTLLFDLLTEDEDQAESLRFDIELLAERLVTVTDEILRWVSLPLGYFGASTGAAAALLAATERADAIRAVVSRGGRPDLVNGELPRVEAPTLLIVGSADPHVLELNRRAATRITAPCQLAVVPGATHLFEEPGALDEVAALAGAWLATHLAAPVHKRPPRRRQRFADRRAAGRELAELLAPYTGRDTVVLALPRGGVPVADEVARRLHAPLDIWLVRKLGVPQQPELGMGALAEGASLVLDRDLVEWSGATPRQIFAIVHRCADEIRRRARLYRGSSPRPDLARKTAILVDDGIATGGTLRAAIRAVRKCGASRVIVAAPVAAPEAVAALHGDVDALVTLITPAMLRAIGLWYDDFRQLTDDEVVAILAASRRLAA